MDARLSWEVPRHRSALPFQVSEHLPSVVHFARGQLAAKRNRAWNVRVGELTRPHPFARRPEALKAEHVRAVGADLAVVTRLRLALAPRQARGDLSLSKVATRGAQMTLLMMVTAGLAIRHGEHLRRT